MKNKGLIAIILAAVIVICAGAAFALTRNKNDSEKTSSAEQNVSVSEEADVSETAAAVSEETSANGSEPSSAAGETTSQAVSQAQEDYSFLKDGVWYYYDDTKQEAYAFEFDGKDEVDITYYNSDNVNGDDSKTASGDADYKVENGEVVIDDVPGNLEADGFTFKISGKTLTDDNGNALDKKDDEKLEYAFNHFNQ